MSRLLIVSNRLPVSVIKRGKSLRFQPSAGGLATGVGSLFKNTYRGKWIGWPGIALEKINSAEKNWITIKKMLDKSNILKEDIDLFKYIVIHLENQIKDDEELSKICQEI